MGSESPTLSLARLRLLGSIKNNLPTLSGAGTIPPQSDSSHGNQDKLWRLTKPQRRNGVLLLATVPGGFLCGHPETQDNGRPLLQPDPRLTQGLSLFHFVTQRMTAGLFPNYISPTSGLGMSAGGGTKSSRLAGKRKIQQGNASLLERARESAPPSNLSVNAGAVMKRDAQSKERVSKSEVSRSARPSCSHSRGQL